MKIHYNFGMNGYEYETDQDELRQAIIKILCKNVKSINKDIYEEDGAYQMAVYMLKLLEQDLGYDLSEMFGEWFEDELEEYFYDQALEEYKEGVAKEENDRWYDLHRHD